MTTKTTRTRSPRQSPPRVFTGAKLPIELRAQVDARAAAEARTAGLAHPNLSATIEQLLGYALANMPAGWKP